MGAYLNAGTIFYFLRKNEAKDILELGLDSELLAPSKKVNRFVLLESGLVALNSTFAF